jgi:putative two-component system response regulator
MKLHPVHSANTILHFDAYVPCHGMVRHHHEQWDGHGYPDGLAGTSIPFGARILAVADTFDALTSDRPYRSGMTVARAIEILEQGAGTQWDSRVVATMVQYVTERSGVMETPPATEHVLVPAAGQAYSAVTE